MKIAIYCSSKANLPEEYIQAAHKLGTWIGQNRHTLVYGGVNAGLMHVVAQAVHDNGGTTIGVVPETFLHRADPIVDQLITATDLNHRKGLMYSLADTFVALPGGLGTFDEVVATLSQFHVEQDTQRRVHLLNLDNVFTPLLTALRKIAQTPLAGDGHLHSLAEAQNLQALIINLNQLS